MQQKTRGHAGIDMVTSAPWRQIVLFSIPLLFGNVLQQLYNTVDSMVVGNLIGSAALAAVGTSAPMIRLLIALFMGVSAGGSIVISQAFGAGEEKRLRVVAHTVIALALLFGVLIAVIGYALSPALLTLMNTPPDVFDMALSYMRVTFLGILSVLLFNVLNGILQGVGDAKSPLYILLVCSVVNVALDLLFVAAFGWGVAGVAWATVIAQVLSAWFGILRVNRRRGALHLSPRHLTLDRAEIRTILRLGVPAGVQNALMSVGNILVQGVINGFGAVIMAANIAVIKVDSFCTMPMMTFATATTVFVGQNMGAGRQDRVRAGTRAALLMSVGLSLAISALLALFGRPLLRLFTQEMAVVEAGMDKIYIIAPFYFCIAVFGVLSGTIRGTGQSVVPMAVGVLTMFIGRVPVAYLLSQRIGANGVHWSLSVQWAAEALIISLYYLLYYRRRLQRLETTPEGNDKGGTDDEKGTHAGKLRGAVPQRQGRG